MSDNSVTVTVTRSAGDDRAVVVFIDTTFEPDASDGGPGLRVRVNDAEVYAGKAYLNDEGLSDHQAESRSLEVDLAQIPYGGEPEQYDPDQFEEE